MTFPRDAVSKPTVIEIRRWKSTACLPQLQEQEAVVSNVIEIPRSSDEALEFKAGVQLALSHSAADLHGYELVILKLTDKVTNGWEDVGGTENFWSLSDIEDEYPSAKDVPDLQFPFAQAEIFGCSAHTVVCRLKSSPPYTITSNGGSFNLPEYPNVFVNISKKVVASKAKIPLQIRVGLLVRGSSHAICFQYTRNSATNNSFEPYVIIVSIQWNPYDVTTFVLHIGSF